MVSSECLKPWQAEDYYFVGRPYFIHEAILKLEELIEPGWTVFEWGSGSSTLWLGADMLVKSAVSLEHDREWYEKTRAELERYVVDNVELILAELGGPYETYISRYPMECFDLVLVDGRNRATCLCNAIPHLAPGGLLVLDDSDREQYQPGVALLAGWQSWGYVSQGGWYRGKTTSIWSKPNESV